MRTHAVRLIPGADLKAELTRLTRDLGLRAGCIVTCVESLAQARLRMPGVATDPEMIAAYDEPMEVLSLSGVLSTDGLHLHIALSRRDGSCVGGHLVAGCLVHTTAEFVIGDLPDVAFRRLVDPATGYNELSVERAPKGEGPQR